MTCRNIAGHIDSFLGRRRRSNITPRDVPPRQYAAGVPLYEYSVS